MKRIFLLLLLGFINFYSFGFSTLGNAGGQVATATFCVPANNYIIYQFSIVQSPGPARTLNAINFTTVGSYTAADVTGFALWRNTVNNFATATNIGGAAASGPGGHTITLAPTDALASGTTYYYWITANFPATAVAGRTINVNGTGGAPPFGVTVSGGGSGGATSNGGVQTINNVPSAVSASAAPNPVCDGSNLTLSGAATGGTSFAWSGPSGYTAVVQNPPAFVTTAGSAGVYTFTATNACGSTTAATATVVVNALPAAISGALLVCLGSTTNLTDASGAGTWVSTLPGVATVSAGGVVSAVSVGTTGIVFTETATGCQTTSIVTVSTSLAPITGVLSICQYTTSTLSNTASGGTWSASGTTVATVDPVTGVVTGLTAGMDSITYTLGGCNNVAIVTINPVPVPGAITGISNICVGGTTVLADTPAGGVWVTGNPLVASIDAVGTVTGIAGGTVTMTYNLTNGCGTTGATFFMTIDEPAAAITGPSIVCVGNQILLADASPGGTWSVSNGNATISVIGLVTGVAAGTDMVTYTVSNTCGTSSVTTNVTIGIPANVGVITGPSSVCIGSTVTMSDDATGGVWSMAVGYGSITTTGVVTGLSQGIDTVLYIGSAVCGLSFAKFPIAIDSYGTAYVTISANPGLISCESVPVTYTAVAVNGGSAPAFIWKVNGIYVSGSTSFTYVPTSGDIITCDMTSNYPCVMIATASALVSTTVIPKVVPTMHIWANAPLGDTVCLSTTDTFTVATTNSGLSPVYQWSVNGAVLGAATSLTYTPNDKDTIKCMFVSSAVCAIPDTMYSTIIMTVDTTQVPTITVTFNPTSDTVCVGTLVTYTAKGTYGGRNPYYRWIKNGVYVATGPSYSYYPNNLDTISCQFFTSSPCATVPSILSNKIIMHTIPVIYPIVTLTSSGGSIIKYEYNDTLTATVTSGGGPSPSYQWVVNGYLIWGATNSTYVINVTRNDTITCIVTGSGNCPNAEATKTIIINLLPSGVTDIKSGMSDLSLLPNPNSGSFMLSGISLVDDKINIDVLNAVGEVVYSDILQTDNGIIKRKFILPNSLSDGIYLLRLKSENDIKVIRFSIMK